MLQRIRDGIQGWISWLIIIAIIASLGLLGVDYYIHGGKNSGNADIAATVNNTIISQQQVSTISRQVRQQQPETPINSQNEQALRASVLQRLIDRALLTQIAKQNDFKVDESQLNNLISQIPEFQENGQFSQARFTAIVNQLGYTPAQFVDNIKTDLLNNQLQAGITNTAFALPDEITSAIRMVKQTRDFSYGIISFNQYLSKINITAEQTQQYYQTNLNQFQTQEKIRLSYVTVSDQNIKASINPSAEELNQYYQDTISNYTQPAQWQIAHIVITNGNNDPTAIKEKLDKIQQGLQAKEDFTSLVKKYSDDTEQGGVLPWVTTDALPPPIQNAIVKLKVGEVSAPIQTSDGYEIIKVLAMKKASVTPLAQVINKVKTAYIQQQTQKQFAAIVQKLQDLSFQNPDSLEPAAKALNISIQNSDWITRNVESKGLFANPQVLQTVFSDNVRTGNNSEVLYPDANTALVLRAKEYQPAQAIPFAQVEAKIKALLAQQASQQQAQSEADKITQELTAGKTLAQITSEYGLKWTSVKNMGRHDPQQKVNSLILQAAFNVPRPQDSKSVSVNSVVLPGNAIAVISVSAVYDNNATVLPAEERIYQTQLQSYYGEFSLSELLSYYRERASISINKPELIES